MNVNRIIEVQNKDTLAALRSFLVHWWEQYPVDVFLAPLESPDGSTVTTQLVHDREKLAGVNPFAPIMLNNAARRADQVLQEHPAQRVAVMLRPCELRAFIELQKRKRGPFDPDSLIIFGVDCLGTFLPAEYERTLTERSSLETTYETLRNAAQGGLQPQPFRTACQLCDWPAPRCADITIGTLGVASDQYLLIISRDEDTDARLKLRAVTDAPASEYQVSHRETVVGAIADLRTSIRQNQIAELTNTHRFGDLGSMLAWFATCTLCGQCLKACPLYTDELSEFLGKSQQPQAGRPPLAELVAISRWLTSCAGCGMCEESCERSVPLILMISALSHRIRSEMDYTSGDTSQCLPWERKAAH